MNYAKIISGLIAYKKAAETNLQFYIEGGDENAIRAGKNMVEDLEEKIAEYRLLEAAQAYEDGIGEGMVA